MDRKTTLPPGQIQQLIPTEGTDLIGGIVYGGGVVERLSYWENGGVNPNSPLGESQGFEMARGPPLDSFPGVLLLDPGDSLAISILYSLSLAYILAISIRLEMAQTVCRIPHPLWLCVILAGAFSV